MDNDEPAVEVIGLNGDDGTPYMRDEIEVPPLCRTCVRKAAEGDTGILCQLTWLDRMLTPADAREPFSCHVYKKEGPQ